MDLVNGEVHEVSNNCTNQEHGQVNEGACYSWPLLAVLEDFIVPFKRVNDLNDGQKLDQTDYGVLECVHVRPS